MIKRRRPRRSGAGGLRRRQHSTVLSHASIANFSNLDFMCFFEKFRLFQDIGTHSWHFFKIIQWILSLLLWTVRNFQGEELSKYLLSYLLFLISVVCTYVKSLYLPKSVFRIINFNFKSKSLFRIPIQVVNHYIIR